MDALGLQAVLGALAGNGAEAMGLYAQEKYRREHLNFDKKRHDDALHFDRIKSDQNQQMLNQNQQKMDLIQENSDRDFNFRQTQADILNARLDKEQNDKLYRRTMGDAMGIAAGRGQTLDEYIYEGSADAENTVTLTGQIISKEITGEAYPYTDAKYVGNGKYRLLHGETPDKMRPVISEDGIIDAKKVYTIVNKHRVQSGIPNFLQEIGAKTVKGEKGETVIVGKDKPTLSPESQQKLEEYDQQIRPFTDGMGILDLLNAPPQLKEFVASLQEPEKDTSNTPIEGLGKAFEQAPEQAPEQEKNYLPSYETITDKINNRQGIESISQTRGFASDAIIAATKSERGKSLSDALIRYNGALASDNLADKVGGVVGATTRYVGDTVADTLTDGKVANTIKGAGRAGLSAVKTHFSDTVPKVELTDSAQKKMKGYNAKQLSQLTPEDFKQGVPTGTTTQPVPKTETDVSKELDKISKETELSDKEKRQQRATMIAAWNLMGDGGTGSGKDLSSLYNAILGGEQFSNEDLVKLMKGQTDLQRSQLALENDIREREEQALSGINEHLINEFRGSGKDKDSVFGLAFKTTGAVDSYLKNLISGHMDTLSDYFPNGVKATPAKGGGYNYTLHLSNLSEVQKRNFTSFLRDNLKMEGQRSGFGKVPLLGRIAPSLDTLSKPEFSMLGELPTGDEKIFWEMTDRGQQQFMDKHNLSSRDEAITFIQNQKKQQQGR